MHRIHQRHNLTAFLSFFIVFGIYAVLKGQEFSFDFLNYHFYNAFAFLHHRITIDYAAAGVQSYFNPLLDVFTYSLLALFNNPEFLRFILGGIGGLNGFFLLLICRELFSPDKTLALWASVVIGITSSIVLSQVGSVMNDAQSALPVMAGLFLIIHALHHDNAKIGLYLWAAILFGIAAGLKLTNAIFIVTGFTAILPLWLSRRITISKLMMFIIGSSLGFALTNGWWMYILYHQFDNPFFPYYNNIFHSPLFSDDTLRDARFGVDTIEQALALSFKLMIKNSMLVVEPRMRDWRLGCFFILTALFLLRYLFNNCKRPRFDSTWLFVFTFIWASYFLWVFEFGIYRYFIPAVLLLGPAIIGLTISLTSNVSKKKQKYVIIFLTLLLIVTTIRPDFGHLKKYDPHFLSVAAPKIPNQSIVIVSDAGESFILPFLNPNTRFINPGFPSLTEDQHAIKIINASQGPIYILRSPIPNLNLFVIQDFYNQYNLEEGECQPIATNAWQIYYKHSKPEPFEICKLMRIKRD